MPCKSKLDLKVYSLSDLIFIFSTKYTNHPNELVKQIMCLQSGLRWER